MGKWEKAFLWRICHFQEIFLFWENEIYFWGNRSKNRRCNLCESSYKGRCEKKSLSKCKEVCRTYDPIQSKYAELLDGLPEIEEIRCNVSLEGFKEGDYMTDLFVLNWW